MKNSIVFSFAFVFALGIPNLTKYLLPINEHIQDVHHLVIGNLSGEITISGYNGDQIEFNHTKHIEEGFESSLSEFDFVTETINDTIWYYLNTKCGDFKPRLQRNKSCKDWSNCHIEYDFSVDLDIRIPRNMNVYVNTINQGDVSLDNIKGSIEVHHINGSIEITRNSGQVEVSSINGDLTIHPNPGNLESIKAYTLNGDINALHPASISANVLFKSNHGELYTNVAQLEEFSPILKPVISKSSGKTKYKISTGKKIKLGKGGVNWSFETFNGDVFIKENINY